MKTIVESVKTSLEIDEDIDLHRTGWVIQRIGWGLMLLFLILAAMGLFGEGVLSERTVADGAACVVYDRFVRRNAKTDLKLTAQPVDGKVHASLSASFLDIYEIEKITPEPASQQVQDGAVRLEFVGSGQARIALELTVREDQMGATSSIIRLNNSELVIRNYIYP